MSRILVDCGLVPENEAWCPKCGASEMNPLTKNTLLIRGYKVGDADGTWWSQCLVCSGYYDKLSLEPTPHRHVPEKGWFSDRQP